MNPIWGNLIGSAIVILITMVAAVMVKKPRWAVLCGGVLVACAPLILLLGEAKSDQPEADAIWIMVQVGEALAVLTGLVILAMALAETSKPPKRQIIAGDEVPPAVDPLAPKRAMPIVSRQDHAAAILRR